MAQMMLITKPADIRGRSGWIIAMYLQRKSDIYISFPDSLKSICTGVQVIKKTIQLAVILRTDKCICI